MTKSTDSAAVFSVSLHARRLLSDGFIGEGSSGKDASVVVDFIPGIPALLARSLPFPRLEYSEFFFQLRVAMLDRLGEVAEVLLNTFYELERAAVDGASKHLVSKPVLAVGPCVPDFMLGDVDDHEYINEKRVEWVALHAPVSVMYIKYMVGWACPCLCHVCLFRHPRGTGRRADSRDSGGSEGKRAAIFVGDPISL